MTTPMSYPAKAVGTTPVTLATFTSTSVVTGFQFTNILNQAISVDLYVTRGGVDYYLTKNTPVPVGSPYIPVGADIKHFMLNGDVLKAVCSVAAGADIWVDAALSI